MLLLILAMTLPLSLGALDSFFTFDDLMNIDYYTSRPIEAFYSNLIVFTSFHRPSGALLYLPLYYIFGMQSYYYYLTGVLLYYLNLVLLFVWVLRLTRNRLVTLITVTLVALHPSIHNVLYNFGAVFELLLMASILMVLLFYKAFLEDREARIWYLLSLVSYLVALNSKETAVVIPVILLCYELLYGNPRTSFAQEIKNSWKRLAPYFGVAIPYALVKIVGEESYWRNNPLYVYQPDWTFVSNLAEYLRFLVDREFQFSGFSAIPVLIACFAIALHLRNRHMLFGLSFALLTLVPVLALPRVWDLFLYVPLLGFSLYLSCLIAESLGFLYRRLLERRFPRFRLTRITKALLTFLFLFWIFNAVFPGIDEARRVHYHDRTAPWKAFAHQLYSLYPTMPKEAILGFRYPPFDFDSHYRWCLHFLVRLQYGHKQQKVYSLPEQTEQFLTVMERPVEAHLFEWKEGILTERKVSTLISDGEGRR